MESHAPVAATRQWTSPPAETAAGTAVAGLTRDRASHVAPTDRLTSADVATAVSPDKGRWFDSS